MTCLPNWPTDKTGDPGLKLWGLARPRLPPVPSGGFVLEVGCRDTPWSEWCKRADPSLTVTAIDWRGVEPMKGVITVRGDVLAQHFGAESLDAIVGLSSFEHIGLGHYEKDPVDPDGDIRLLRLVRTWLKPGGWCYFDVPYDPTAYRVQGTRYRCYDDAAIRERLGAVEVVGYTTSAVEGWIDKPETPSVSGKPYYYVALLARKGDG